MRFSSSSELALLFLVKIDFFLSQKRSRRGLRPAMLSQEDEDEADDDDDDDIDDDNIRISKYMQRSF